VFSAEDVFEGLYRPAVSKSLQSMGEAVAAVKILEIKAALLSRRAQLEYHLVPRPSLDLHKQKVHELLFWRVLQSDTTCLFCLMRTPQHLLHCGHALCDVCVKSLAQPCDGDYSYEIRTCFFCSQAAEFKRHVKPATCGIRVLSLDGGGVRGVISLENIQLLQATFAQSLDINLLDLFDMVTATSAGKPQSNLLTVP
jgi:hypothetical protein